MEKVTVVVTNELGLHARPASVLVKETSKFNSNINIAKGEKSYNAKSIMNILSMAAAKGDSLVITAEGADEKEALATLKALFESNLGE